MSNQCLRSDSAGNLLMLVTLHRIVTRPILIPIQDLCRTLASRRCKLAVCAPATPGAWAVPSDTEKVFLIRHEQWQGPAPSMGLPRAQRAHGPRGAVSMGAPRPTRILRCPMQPHQWHNLKRAELGLSTIRTELSVGFCIRIAVLDVI